MKLAYGRVSTRDKNSERQLVKFRELGVEERYISVDKLSGKDFERPKYQAVRLLIRRNVSYEIPSNLTDGKRNVEVKFVSTEGKLAGGV
ncbi:hypothetical protein C7121_00860 [Paenibacillus glucanolyticus]|uniref:Resolvase/invertase-type recombinase catalytic domain-containing protein n=1 Tax=Paenibacillus glucanolyticus TaxID=59843 RepID=A0A163KBK3_9BACL|nr:MULTISPECIES: recombinase family protein [Paenibacillus]ANA81082.1 hypothetical protein A3958_14355 [Paenibacillus glucanolyticus]AVV54799.1 hypothetical protein C7121_00860 [Paenibacillus glucanolyticus]ETT36349.1 Site-specific recombinase [Paenibacillus sp. FSL R5-808]KZS47118.1 hypothetical protein AWU65_14885 [Paenibacillus glucanolyticus]MDH6672699.1 hypothetical protein [Paenibacillus sp. LBL]